MESGSIRPACISSVIGVVVFVLVAAAWELGWFQAPELWIYDCFVAARSNPKTVDPRIVIVTQTEQDVASFDFPMHDSVLARLLDKIESGGPVVIGVDLYRDLPEPRDKSELPLLDASLKNENIVTIFLSAGQGPFQIAPPASLVSDPTRYGFNNLITDGKTVRRGCLSAKLADGKSYYSFAALIATDYLTAKRIDCGMDGKNPRLGKTVFHRFEGNDGGYVGANHVGQQFLLDFRGPRQFQTISISDALALKDTRLFNDKIALIGSVAVSSNDLFETPLDSFASGVVIHAQTINQLLRAATDGERPTETASVAFRWFSLACGCLAGVLAGFLVRKHIPFALTIVAGSAAILLVAWWMFLAGYWTLALVPLAGFLATSIFVKGYAATYQEEQRAILMRLFSQRVSPEVAQEIWSHRHLFLQGGRPAAKRLVATVVFTDLKGYSTISEKMPPAELIAWVNECTSALAQHVRRNGGYVSKYIGDGIMALFGIPVPRVAEEEIKRDAINAVRCALSMAAEISTMNAKWKIENKPLAGLRVGIYTGEIMAGELGSEDHLEYSVIGDTVNIASRLESFDKEGQWTGESGECRILIGELTHRYIEGIFPSRFVGKISLKGKQETTGVYKVFDNEEDASKHQPIDYENTPRPN